MTSSKRFHDVMSLSTSKSNGLLRKTAEQKSTFKGPE